MSLRRACHILALTALAPTAPLAAQDPQPAVVAGRVLVRADTAVPSPASGATVGIVGTSPVATTGADGRFLIASAPTGARTLRIQLPGYRTTDRALRVRSGDTVRTGNGFIDIVITPSAWDAVRLWIK